MSKQSASTAEFKHIRISPTKLRSVANLVRGKRVEDALDVLRFTSSKGAVPVFKLVKSAIANADQKNTVNIDKLFIKTIKVDEGPRWKRFRPRSRGMANPYVKRTSHLSIELAEK